MVFGAELSPLHGNGSVVFGVGLSHLHGNGSVVFGEGLSSKETHSGLLQIQPKNFFFSKAIGVHGNGAKC